MLNTPIPVRARLTSSLLFTDNQAVYQKSVSKSLDTAGSCHLPSAIKSAALASNLLTM
ncbi:hypothetical protein LguiA_008090 [Lonicera macranthoides]